MTQGNSDSPFKFDGFEPANTTPVPDVFFDELLPHLSEAQLKAMLYIIRRTLGFKKTSDAISLKQFRWGITTRDGKQLDQGCGLKNFTSITRALNDLEEMGCVERVRGETDEGDPATTLYRIRFRGTTPNGVPTTPNGVPTTLSVVGTTPSGVPPLRETEGGYYAKRRAGTTRNGGRVLRETEPQETVLQQTVLQQTESKKERSLPTPTTLSPVSDSSIHSVDTSINSSQDSCNPGGDASPPPTSGVKSLPQSTGVITATALLSWLSSEHVVKASSKSKVAEQVELLLPHIDSQATLHDHCVFAAGEIKGANKTLYLGNLVQSLDAWLQSRAEQVNDDPESIGMSEDELGQVFASLPPCIPDSSIEFLAVDERRQRFTLALRYGDGARDFYEILHLSDAPYVYGNPQVQAECMAYGAAMLQQEAV